MLQGSKFFVQSGIEQEMSLAVFCWKSMAIHFKKSPNIVGLKKHRLPNPSLHHLMGGFLLKPTHKKNNTFYSSTICRISLIINKIVIYFSWTNREGCFTQPSRNIYDYANEQFFLIYWFVVLIYLYKKVSFLSFIKSSFGSNLFHSPIFQRTILSHISHPFTRRGGFGWLLKKS